MNQKHGFVGRRPDSSNFARKVKTRREEKNMEREDVDIKAALPEETTWYIEDGRCKGLTERQLKRLAKILGYDYRPFKEWYLEEYEIVAEASPTEKLSSFFGAKD